MIKKMLTLTFAAMLMFSACFTAGAIDLQAGVEVEAILDKDVELENLGMDVQYSAQYYNLVTDVKLGDFITVTPKAGINSFQLKAENVGTIGEIEGYGGIGFNLGLDIKADVLKTEYADLALTGGYRFSRTDLDSVDIAGLEINNPIETILTTHEWEIGAQVSKDLSTIEALQGWIALPVVPYIGVVYSDLRGDIDVNLSALNINEEVQAKDNFGLRFGIAAQPIQDLQISLDIGLIDQVSIGGTVTYKF